MIRRNDEQQDILKVLKYGLDRSERLLDETTALRSEMAAENERQDAFLDRMDRALGIDSAYALSDFVPSPLDRLEPVPYRSFSDLCSLADVAYPYEMTIQEILTSAEVESARRHVDEIYETFDRQTRLTGVDAVFLATATALQALRQYVLDPWLKTHRRAAGRNDEPGRKQNAEPGWYRVETERIPVIRVPFDVQKYSGNSTVQGFLKGAGNHRLITLGHDPILGWPFGTMNILTNTITVSSMRTAHVKQQGNTNVIYAIADTGRAGRTCIDRFRHEGNDGKRAVGLALLREAAHLRSDIGTKDSLPIPIVSVISPKLAGDLSRYGIDTAGVGMEMGLSAVINLLIAMVHRLFFDESVDDRSLYEVRTRKILLISNSMASASNIIASALKRDARLLDVGGILVTIGRLFRDVGFMARIKQEYIESRMAADFRGTVDEVDRMYGGKFAN